MKSIIPDPAQLDELAAGLDAGWDEEPADVSASQPPLSPSQPPLSPSQPPHSVPPSLEALDADWGDTVDDSSESERASAQAPRAGAAVHGSKRERREVERKRRTHQAQQNSASKKQRKAERLAAARQASERQRSAEQQALVERQKRPEKSARKRPKSKPEDSGALTPVKRIAKRARREESPIARPVAAVKKAQLSMSKTDSKPLVVERGVQKLVVPFLIALLVAITLGFALSRAR